MIRLFWIMLFFSLHCGYELLLLWYLGLKLIDRWLLPGVQEVRGWEIRSYQWALWPQQTSRHVPSSWCLEAFWYRCCCFEGMSSICLSTVSKRNKLSQISEITYIFCFYPFCLWYHLYISYIFSQWYILTLFVSHYVCGSRDTWYMIVFSVQLKSVLLKVVLLKIPTTKQNEAAVLHFTNTSLLIIPHEIFNEFYGVCCNVDQVKQTELTYD